MDKDTYDYIMEYCSQKYDHFLTQHEKDSVLRQFIQSYFQAIDVYKNEHAQTEPDEEQKKTMIKSLLSDNTLHGYADSSQIYYKNITDTIEAEYAKKLGKQSFWKSVFASILANLLYAISLIALFWVAHDQITSWLTQLLQGSAPT